MADGRIMVSITTGAAPLSSSGPRPNDPPPNPNDPKERVRLGVIDIGGVLSPSEDGWEEDGDDGDFGACAGGGAVGWAIIVSGVKPVG